MVTSFKSLQKRVESGAGSEPLTKNPDLDPGGPKTYGSYGSGPRNTGSSQSLSHTASYDPCLYLDVGAGAGTAILSVIVEDGAVSNVHGLVHGRRVREYDERALAAQLQRHPLQVGGGGRRHDGAAHAGGAGEGHLVNIHVGGQGGAWRKDGWLRCYLRIYSGNLREGKNLLRNF